MGEQTRKILLCVCGGSFLVALIVVIACLADSYHIIQEGSVGIYYVQGRLQETLAKPGKITILKAQFGCNLWYIHCFHLVLTLSLFEQVSIHFRRQLGPTIFNGSGGNHYKTKN